MDADASNRMKIVIYYAAWAIVCTAAAGLLNALTWPMMMLSGVFYSMEAAPHWLQLVAKVFPLTQMLDAARSIMIDGAGLAQVWKQVSYLGLISAVFLVLGAWSFKWRAD